MELVGTAKEYHGEGDDLRVVFRCTNKEEFDLKVSPVIKRIPPDQVVRAFAELPEWVLGESKPENVIVHWEDL